MATLQNNMVFQFTGTMLTSDTSVGITNDLERDLEVDFTDAYIEVKNRKGNKVERMKASATGGTFTASKRGLDQSDSDVEVSGLKQQRNEGSIAYVTILSSQLVDRQADNTFEGDQTFEGNVILGTTDATKYGVKLKALTTTQRNALSSPPDGTIILNTTSGAIEAKVGGSFQGLGAGATTPNASDTVTGKVRLSDLAQAIAGTDTEGGDPLVIIPSVLKSITDGILAPLYFGDGADGDVTISSGTTTLTRDMYYNNLTITSPGVLNPNGYRVFVKGTIAGTGTINRNGNNGGNGSNGVAGTAATTLNQGSLNAEIASVAGKAGNNSSGQPGNAGTAATNSLSNVSSVAGGAGGAGGSGNLNPGGAAGASAATTRSNTYNKVFPLQLVHPATSGALTQATGISSSGGGASGSGDNGGYHNGGSGGGSGGNGGLIWIFANTRNFTGTCTATGGTGGNGSNAYIAVGGGGNAGGGGGGGGGNGGILLRCYKTLTADCTKTLTGGNGGTAGSGISGGGNGTAGQNGNAGVTISITI